MDRLKGNLKSTDSDTSETDVDALFASPSKTGEHDEETSCEIEPSNTPPTLQANARQGGGRFDAEEARQAALQAELEGVRNINRVIEGVVSSLDRAKQNMEVPISLRIQMWFIRC